ncbi:hypothetical protein HYV50_03860 [Candidatus Pacearchaeota archaeon]|nr:hypothetical protein [Candidatus Pacearchaeota archaeon]
MTKLEIRIDGESKIAELAKELRKNHHAYQEMGLIFVTSINDDYPMAVAEVRIYHFKDSTVVFSERARRSPLRKRISDIFLEIYSPTDSISNQRKSELEEIMGMKK